MEVVPLVQKLNDGYNTCTGETERYSFSKYPSKRIISIINLLGKSMKYNSKSTIFVCQCPTLSQK